MSRLNLLCKRWMSTLAALWLAVICAVGIAQAHEVQPAIADLEISATSIEITIEWTLEAATAEIDLSSLFDTNQSENSDRYDALRALDPFAMETEFRSIWPSIREKITLRAGSQDIVPEIVRIEIPPIGNTELPRQSVLHLSAALPNDQSPIVIGWTGDLGTLVVRQQGIENGYTGFLTNGVLSDEISRIGPDDQTALEALGEFIFVGFDHIVPKGLDHIVFVLGLFFLSLSLGPLLWQVSAFTLAHTVTLALGALNIITISPDIVEPLIAASIVYVGVENILSRGLTPWRPAIVFAFGLLHGLGFASVLADFGLGNSHFVPKLIGFNVGVEIGQLTVIAVAFLLVGLWFGKKPWYRTRIATPASLIIALVGAWWLIERTLL